MPMTATRDTHENKPSNDETPEAHAWGLRVVEPLAKKANGYNWLPKSNSTQNVSLNCNRDRLSPFAPARKSELLRIQEVSAAAWDTLHRSHWPAQRAAWARQEQIRPPHPAWPGSPQGQHGSSTPGDSSPPPTDTEPLQRPYTARPCRNASSTRDADHSQDTSPPWATTAATSSGDTTLPDRCSARPNRPPRRAILHLFRTFVIQAVMPTLVDHDDMRTRLLDAAGELFAARGYAATGMRDLAAAAGVSTGSLYHYFPDKRALFEQLVERTVDADLAELEETLGVLPRPTSVRLDAFLRLVRQGEPTLQLQSAVLVEYARLAQTDRGVSLAASRAAHVRYAAALARLLDVSRERADLVLHAVSGLLLQRFCDGGATPFAPIERQLRALCGSEETR